MKQEIEVTISDEKDLTILNDGSGLIKIRIKDEGKEIEVAFESDAFFGKLKRFANLTN